VSNNAWEGQIRHEPDTPTGISAAIGAGMLVVAAFLSAALPPSAGDVRLGVLALALAGFAALTVDPRAVAAVGVLAFLVLDGFLVNQLGELSWHGQADQTRLLILAGAGRTTCPVTVSSHTRRARQGIVVIEDRYIGGPGMAGTGLSAGGSFWWPTREAGWPTARTPCGHG
jgi:hypothetical protein